MRIVMVQYSDEVDLSSIPKGTPAVINNVIGGSVVAIIDAIDPPEAELPGTPMAITITGIAEVSDPSA